MTDTKKTMLADELRAAVGPVGPEGKSGHCGLMLRAAAALEANEKEMRLMRLCFATKNAALRGCLSAFREPNPIHIANAEDEARAALRAGEVSS